LAVREPPSAREKLRRIAEYSRWAKASVRLNTFAVVPFEIRDTLARLWEEYVRELPPDVASREGIAVFGYPQVVLLRDIPRKIREDPNFARLMIEMYGG